MTKIKRHTAWKTYAYRVVTNHFKTYIKNIKHFQSALTDPRARENRCTSSQPIDRTEFPPPTAPDGFFWGTTGRIYDRRPWPASGHLHLGETYIWFVFIRFAGETKSTSTTLAPCWVVISRGNGYIMANIFTTSRCPRNAATHNGGIKAADFV